MAMLARPARTRTTYCAAIALTSTLLGVISLAAQLPPLRGEAILPGDALITGRVIDRDTTLPLPDVLVQLVSADLGRVSTARTDRQGLYTFGSIAPGAYRLIAQHDGYIPQTHGAPDARMGLATPEAVIAVERTTRTHVDFALVRMATIAGRVLSEDGRPLEEMTVTLTMITERGIRVGGRWSARTNERGEYVVSNVPEGMFQASAVLTGEDVRSGTEFRRREIYYPGTDEAERATTLTVSAGQRINDIDIVLYGGELLRLQGAFVATARDTSVEATLLDGISVQNVAVADDGTFTTPRLAAGRYTLIARSRDDHAPEATWLTVNLASELTGLVLGLMPTGTISGHVVTDDGSPVPNALEVTAILADDGREIDTLMRDPRDRVGISPDGRFELRGMFGERVLRILGDTNGWALAQVLVGRTSVASIVIDPGRSIDDVRIVLKRQPRSSARH